MTSSWWNSTGATNLTRGLSSITGQLSNNLKDILTEATEENYDSTTEVTQAREEIDDFESRKQALIEECTSLKKQCDELTMQKQVIEIKSNMLLAESRRIIEEKDNELKRLRETTNTVSSNKDTNHIWTNLLDDNQSDVNEFVKYERIINELKDENSRLKDEMITLRGTLESQQQTGEEYDEQIHQLQLRIKELEDWNGDDHKKIEPEQTDYASLQSNMDLLVSRNRQLENDLQRLQSHQRNNQLALERLDEYEETISQLQEELDQLRSNKKQQQTGSDEDVNRLLTEERKRYDEMSRLLDETRLQLKTEMEQSNEKILQTEISLNERFEREKTTLQKQIEVEKSEREIFEKQINELQQFKHEELKNQMEEEENRLKEMNLRDMLERQLIELNEDVQALENDKNELNYQLDELRQQLQSRDRQIQTFQTSAASPGSPATMTLSSDISGTSQSSGRLLEFEAQVFQNEQQFRQLNSIYDQFVILLPNELSSTNDNTQLSLADRFLNLFEQISAYVGTFSITQEELDSLKQILIEKQDDLEKLQSHFELTTNKLTELQEKQSLLQKEKSFDSDEDELEEILQFQPRAPSRQSLLSITPGEKQQLIAQNELLSALLIEKEQELISLQQAEKTREDLLKNFEKLRINLQQMELDREVKQVELNDIRNVLDEKLRENSSLKKEKMYFIEKIADFERERQEQQTIIHVSPKKSSQEEDKSLALIATKTGDQNIEQNTSEEQYKKLRSDYDQLVDLSKQQHDESLSYYNEYTRILLLYNDLNTKHSQLQIDYESVQSLIQQKSEAYLQCQNELNTYQNLLYHEKKKSDDIDLLRSTLNEREIKCQQLICNETQLLIKQSELERDLKLFEQSNFHLKANEQLQLELKRSTHERDLAVVEKKQCEHEMELNLQKCLQSVEQEQKLTNEIERLRAHLIQMEKSFTSDLLSAEDREKSLRNQLAQLDDSNRMQTELIQQLNTSSEQSQQAHITELGALKYEYAKVEELNTDLNNQLQYQMKCSQNLQNVLEQFQREREQHINGHLSQYQDSLQEQISITARLTNENNEIRQRLEEYNEVLSSSTRLKDEIEKTSLLLKTLQNEVDRKDKQILEYEDNFQTTNGARVEKQLVKNILLSYFHTPIDKQQEVIPLLGALVGFTQEEYQKAIDAILNNYHNSTSSSWLTGWLGTSSVNKKTSSETPVYNPDKSFTELLIQYVDQQSTNNPIAKLNTDEYLRRYQKLSVPTSTNSTHLSSDDKQSTNAVLSTSNVEQELNQSSLPSSSSTYLDDLLQV